MGGTGMKYTLGDLSKVDLGRQGENLARTIEFDVSEILEEWPGARISLAVKRKYDSEPYLAETRLEGNVLFWPITSADTEYPGNGCLEIRAHLGDVLAKSVVGNTIVHGSLTGGHAKPPDPSKWLLDEVREATENAISSAEVASAAAGLANASAGNADKAADKANAAADQAAASSAAADEAAKRANQSANTLVETATEEEVTNMLDDIFV